MQTLTVAEIKANTTFSATFVEKPVVTIKAGENGSVEVKGTVNGKADTALTSGTHVDFGTDLIVTATPESGYVVGTINGSAVNEDKANGAKDKTLEKVGENTKLPRHSLQSRKANQLAPLQAARLKSRARRRHGKNADHRQLCGLWHEPQGYADAG